MATTTNQRVITHHIDPCGVGFRVDELIGDPLPGSSHNTDIEIIQDIVCF